MKISARVENTHDEHRVTMATDGNTHSIVIPPKTSGAGSSVNGGELLFLALATCYCNDIYREAATSGIEVERVEVDVEGQFGGPGEPATNVMYHVRIVASAPEAEIEDLLRRTDTLAEVHNTLRVRTDVTLDRIEANPAPDRT